MLRTLGFAPHLMQDAKNPERDLSLLDDTRARSVRFIRQVVLKGRLWPAQWRLRFSSRAILVRALSNWRVWPDADESPRRLPERHRLLQHNPTWQSSEYAPTLSVR